MTDGKDSENWLMKSFGGVNILGLVGGILVIAYAFWEATGGSNTRLTVIERQLTDATKRFDVISAQLDSLRAYNTEIAIMRLTGENTVAIVNRLEASVNALQESQRDLNSKVRDLERRLPNESR